MMCLKETAKVGSGRQFDVVGGLCHIVAVECGGQAFEFEGRRVFSGSLVSSRGCIGGRLLGERRTESGESRSGLCFSRSGLVWVNSSIVSSGNAFSGRCMGATTVNGSISGSRGGLIVKTFEDGSGRHVDRSARRFCYFRRKILIT